MVSGTDADAASSSNDETFQVQIKGMLESAQGRHNLFDNNVVWHLWSESSKFRRPFHVSRPRYTYSNPLKAFLYSSPCVVHIRGYRWLTNRRIVSLDRGQLEDFTNLLAPGQ